LSVDPFAGVLDPFAYWDISATYARYSTFFDLVIYCAIFMALARVVFIRKFTGAPGKVLATTVGLALGISLAIAGQQFRFSLREAGPFAVLLALLLVGFLILHTLVQIQVSWTLALPLTYVLIYLLVRAMSPALFDSLAEKIPFINLLSLIMFLICIWRVGVALWPRRDGNNRLGGSDASFIAGLDREDEEKEVKVEKRVAKKAAPQVYHETRRIERNLDSIRNELRKDHPDWRAMAQALSDTARRSDEVIRTVDKIRTLDRRLRNFDWRQLQHLSEYCGQLNGTEQGQLKEQIQLERAKIVQEHAIDELAERCERRHGDYRRVLDEAQKACLGQNRDTASRDISTALSIEAQQREDLDRLRQSERRLLDLTRLKLKRE
jgi:ribosomal protein L17